MKQSFFILFTLMSVLVSSATSCNKKDDIIIENNNPMANGKIKITVNSQTFTATFLDNNSGYANKIYNLKLVFLYF